jgi:MFS family permease
MPWPTGLRALAHRDYRLFWAGQLVSLCGTWMQSVGQSWLVLELTNSPLKLGLIGTLQYAPMLLLSFVSGAIADRVRKRRLILGTQTALMCQAFALSALAWSGHVQYWHVAVLATCYGLAQTLDMPSRQSFVADLVGKRDIMSAIALNSTVFNGARVVGPAVAGLLVARYGVALAFFLNGLSFVAVITALLLMRTEGAPRPRGGTTMREEIVDGARYAIRTPVIALVLGLIVSVSLFVINFNTLVPLIARDVLHEGAHGFGLLMASLGAGAIVGALVLTLLGPDRPAVSIVIAGALVVCAATMSLAAVRQFWLAAAVLMIIGFAQIFFTATSNTALQVTAPDRLRGRVMSLYAMAFVGASPFGSFLVGFIAETLGVPTACAIGGGSGLLLVTLLAVRWHRRGPAAIAADPAAEGG